METSVTPVRTSGTQARSDTYAAMKLMTMGGLFTLVRETAATFYSNG